MTRCDSSACVAVEFVDGRLVEVWSTQDPSGPHVFFTFDEWEAFTAGVKAGEYDTPGGTPLDSA